MTRACMGTHIRTRKRSARGAGAFAAVAGILALVGGLLSAAPASRWPTALP